MWWHSQCWFGHTRVRERDPQGRLILVCSECRDAVPAFSDREILRGPQHQQAPTLGQPTGKAIPSQWFERRKVS